MKKTSLISVSIVAVCIIALALYSSQHPKRIHLYESDYSIELAKDLFVAQASTYDFGLGYGFASLQSLEKDSWTVTLVRNSNNDGDTLKTWIKKTNTAIHTDYCEKFGTETMDEDTGQCQQKINFHEENSDYILWDEAFAGSPEIISRILPDGKIISGFFGGDYGENFKPRAIQSILSIR